MARARGCRTALGQALSAAELAGPPFKQVVVTASWVGAEPAGDFESASAGAGAAFADQLEDRPLLRPGELLEVVPAVAFTDSEDGPGGRNYLAITAAWRRNSAKVTPISAYPQGVRRTIYTTNAIESLNSTIRRSV